MQQRSDTAADTAAEIATTKLRSPVATAGWRASAWACGAAALVAGCDVTHHHDPELVNRVVALSVENARLQGAVQSLQQSNQMFLFLLVLSVVVVATLGVLAYLHAQRRVPQLFSTRRQASLEAPNFVVFIDRATGESRRVALRELPPPVRAKLLAYRNGGQS